MTTTTTTMAASVRANEGTRFVPGVRTRRCGGRTSANVASELSGTRRRNEYEIDRARERVKKKRKGKEKARRTEREDRNAHAEGREEGHTWRVRHDTVESERETPRMASVRGKEKRIDRERRGVDVEGEDARGGTYTVAS